MDASGGGSAGSGDKKNDNQIPKKEEQPYHFTFHQEVKLKAFFENCPQPNEAHCVQLAKELGIESEKIKLWFQNQSQAKVLNTYNTQSFLVLNKEAAAAQEKTRMLEIAGDAMDEMVRLINDKTLWRPLYDVSGFVLVSSRKDDHMNQLLHPHEESSKCTLLLVRCRGKQLVDMILDSVELANTFPTIVSKAETVAVVNVGTPENRHGALLVMYEKVLILSPLVPSREFLFLRYCRQVENGVWMIVDVSIDSFQERLSTYSGHKYLSGCMIREMSDEKCEVTWIEHVVVEGSSKGIRLYGNVLHDFNAAFGAKRLLFALQRKCEKNHCSSFEYIPTYAEDKEMRPQAVRKNLVELSNRMIKSFGRTLNKPDDMIPYTELVGDISDPYGIQLTLCSNEINHSDGKVMCAVASIHLPFPPQTVFYFLTDETRRHEWDIVAIYNPVRELTYISIGDIHSYNRISVLETTNPECKTFIVQECCIDPMGAYVVFTPIDFRGMDKVLNGDNSSEISILPSCFMISRDNQKGSLLTLSLQVLAGSVDSLEDQDLKSLESIGTVFMGTIEKIKTALSSSDED